MRIPVLAVGVLLLAQAAAGQPPTPSLHRPGSPGDFSPERVARIDRFLDRYVDDNRIAGAVALVLQDGRTVYERAVGWRDREAGRRMTMDTLFRIASQTKAITSVALLSLYEEGLVGLDDPVSRYIPEYAHTRVAVRGESGVTLVDARRPITIRDLLTHTSGISYGTDDSVAALYAAQGLGPAAGPGWYTADKDEPICATSERLARLPFVAQPGTEWVYGYGIDVLGCVVERIAGLPLDEVIRRTVTGPLAMTDTRFFVPPAERDRLAAVYASDQSGHAVRAPEGASGQGHYVDGPRRSFAGGAGLVSTARDYARFLEMIRNGGRLGTTRLLGPRTVALMTTNQVGALYPVPGMGFGLGFETTDRYGANGTDAVGSYGWGGAYGTLYRVDPEARLVILLMLQLLPNSTDVRVLYPNLVHQALLDPAPARR